MKAFNLVKVILIFSILTLIYSVVSAAPVSYKTARTLQREGRYDLAIEAYKTYLTQPINDNELNDEELGLYTDALVQLMNTYQSKGEPEACITTLREVYNSSPILQSNCLRDYYSVLGYALSRTENMNEAEATMLKALTLPLHNPTPGRYFRDYAYAAAVFYSNPDYQEEVINWCQEALYQAQLSKNTSGQQWVTAMLGSLYKRSGDLNKALDLFQQSKKESEAKNDHLGILNSLHTLIDLFLYWDIPEYANIYATEAICVEKRSTSKNPMVSAQTYINKGRALHQLGQLDSISIYIEQARQLCESLPYNSGMVDVDLLNGICLTEKGGDYLQLGIKELQNVAEKATAANRAKAYHQLAQTYLKDGQEKNAEIMLDSLYVLLSQSYSPNLIHINYEAILDHYLKRNNKAKVEQYLHFMLQEQNAFKEQKVNYNLVEAVVDLQTGKSLQELKIIQLKQANQRLWLVFSIITSLLILLIVLALLFRQKKHYKKEIKAADEKISVMSQDLVQSNIEKEKTEQKIKEYLENKDNRQELETLTPRILKEGGEYKFRECFELLYPLFLHRLREKVPAVTRREEILSMLIVLKQDNKKIAELLAIEPRSVLMLRHRFRQKIGMTTDISLETFIEDLLA